MSFDAYCVQYTESVEEPASLSILIPLEDRSTCGLLFQFDVSPFSQLLFFSCVVLHVLVAVRATSGHVLQNSSFVNGKTTRPVCVVHVDNERRRRPFRRGSSTVASNRSFRNVVRRRSYCSMVERGKFSLVVHLGEIREEQA